MKRFNCQIMFAVLLIGLAAPLQASARSNQSDEGTFSVAGLSLGQQVPPSEREGVSENVGFRYEFRIANDEARFSISSDIAILLRAPEGAGYYDVVEELSEINAFISRGDLPASETWQQFRAESRLVQANLRRSPFVNAIDCEGSTYTFHCADVGARAHPQAASTRVGAMLVRDTIVGVSAVYSFPNNTAPAIEDVSASFTNRMPDARLQVESDVRHIILGQDESIEIVLRNSELRISLTPRTDESTPDYLWEAVTGYFQQSLDAWTSETRQIAEEEQAQARRSVGSGFQ